MPKKINITQVDAIEAAMAVNETLKRIDERLVGHGERVAYIACKLNELGDLQLDQKILFILCLFHDIGAYKTDEIDRMIEFETKNVWNHSIFGYLFLKYMTPINEYAEAVLYHHTPWHVLKEKHIKYTEYAALLHLADRMDIAVHYQKDEEKLKRLLENAWIECKPEHVTIAKQYMENSNMRQCLKNGSYEKENKRWMESFVGSAQEAIEYLKMIVYSIDFRSEHTVTHTINTVSLALNMARHFGLSEAEQENIYFGALLHDVGKIAIPISILEYPGKLSDDDMVIMRTHVIETRRLLEGIIPDYICELAARHHEKLDGTGYPEGLCDENLTFSQRIIAVADIVSALSSRRSYKDPFPKEKTIAILTQMKEKQLDTKLCEYICEQYDTILQNTEEDRIEIITKYQTMTNEFEEMKQAVMLHKMDNAIDDIE